MWEVDHVEDWVLKNWWVFFFFLNWWFWTVVLEKILQGLFYSKEIKPVSPKGNQLWIFFGRTIAEVEAPMLWPPDVKSCLIGKDPDAGGRRRRGRQSMGWLDGITDWMTWIWASSGGYWRTGKPDMLHAIHGVSESRIQLRNWTTTNYGI